MDFKQYSEIALSTKNYPQEMPVVYPALGLAGECGEAVDKIKKVIRDHGGVFSETKSLEIIKELGDVLWYVNAIAVDLGYSLEDVARINAEKIRSRKLRGTLQGEGDER